MRNGTMGKRYLSEIKKRMIDIMSAQINRLSNKVFFLFMERIIPRIAKGAIMPKEINGS